MRINIDHQRIWFASDYHFCHANVIKYDGRPFNNVEEMNQTLIDNWNEVVGDDDVVFYLGDLSFDKNGVTTQHIVDQLKGKIHFILGNHDREKDVRSLKRFETISDYISLTVTDHDNPRKKQGIVMMHYPILSWDKHHHGEWHLHGHCHQSLVTLLPDYYKRKVLDLGCNGWAYAPISYSEIKSIMNSKVIELIDHHG